MKQESMPVEQDGMALAAEAPVLDAEDTPKVDESTPTEGTTDAEALAAPAPAKETEEIEHIEEPAPAEAKKTNLFRKVWAVLIDKAEFTVPLLFVFTLVMGLIIGYSVLGDGPVSDVFNPETWTHIVKLIFG